MIPRTALLAAVLAPVLLAVAPAAAQLPGPDVDDPAITSGQAAQDLAAARALWKQSGPRSYRYRVALSCFCAQRGDPPTVTVRGGRPVRGTKTGEDIATLPRLFRAVDRAIAGRAASLKVTYDARYGFVRKLWVDSEAYIADEELGYTVDRFTVLTR